MTEQTQDLLTQVLRLPLEERAALAAELLASLDGEVDPEAEAAWTAEIARRARAVMSGQSAGAPWDEVRARVKERLRRG